MSCVASVHAGQAVRQGTSQRKEGLKRYDAESIKTIVPKTMFAERQNKYHQMLEMPKEFKAANVGVSREFMLLKGNGMIINFQNSEFVPQVV